MKTKQELTIEEIWEQFHKSHDEYSRNLLMEHYRNIVKYSADRLHSKLPDKVELDDLVSAGIFGLMDAIDAFDPERGVKFETYCSPRIRGSILDELRSMDWVPRLVRARAHHVTHELGPELGEGVPGDPVARPARLRVAGEGGVVDCANCLLRFRVRHVEQRLLARWFGLSGRTCGTGGLFRGRRRFRCRW